jgi:hypothetical protein
MVQRDGLVRQPNAMAWRWPVALARWWTGSTAHLLLALASMVDLCRGGQRLLQGPPRQHNPGATENIGAGPPKQRRQRRGCRLLQDPPRWRNMGTIERRICTAAVDGSSSLSVWSIAAPSSTCSDDQRILLSLYVVYGRLLLQCLDLGLAGLDPN